MPNVSHMRRYFAAPQNVPPSETQPLTHQTPQPTKPATMSSVPDREPEPSKLSNEWERQQTKVSPHLFPPLPHTHTRMNLYTSIRPVLS